MATIITVQGTHTAWFDAERATIELSAAFDGPKRESVLSRATAVAADITAELTPLHDAKKGPVVRWSSDRVNVWSDRPWNNEGKRLPLVYHAAIGITATFRDFDALSRVIEQVAAIEGVTIGGITWDLTDARRETVTDEVRRLAVDDAVRKASSYAAAGGVGSPTVIAIADPGMLGDGRGGADAGIPHERMAMMSAMDSGGAALTLTPEQIRVSTSVDVRFTAGELRRT